MSDAFWPISHACWQHAVFQSTFIVAKRLEELKNLMQQLPDYADQFLNMICKILQEYKDTCHACYRGKHYKLHIHPFFWGVNI